MLSSVIHECPRCSGAINREHYAERKFPGADGDIARTDKFMWCEFCGVGFESSTYPNGEVFALEHVAQTDPGLTVEFLDRLQRAAAA